MLTTTFYEEHPFAQYVRILGKGKKGSRPLTQEEAYSAMRMIMADEVEPTQLGAFMMLARKFDRIEHQSEKHGWDIFGAGEAFKGETGLLDDIRDLRRYLILVEDFVLQTDNNKEEEEWDYSTGSEEEENDQ